MISSASSTRHGFPAISSLDLECKLGMTSDLAMILTPSSEPIASTSYTLRPAVSRKKNSTLLLLLSLIIFQPIDDFY